jgi:predicted acetyltransferase
MDFSEIPIRVGSAADWDAIDELLGYVFHHDVEAEMHDLEGSVYEPDRSLVAEDAGAVVGHAGAYTRELSVPGAVLPAAYISLVGVAPTHRRRGLLNRMMRRQLHDIASAGREPVAVLWASEGKIYPRYGYGLAAERLELELATRELRPPQAPPVPGARLRLVRPADAIGDFTAVYERLRAGRPGWPSRGDRWWKVLLADIKDQRDGATPLRGVVHDTPDGPTGYAYWRVRSAWTSQGPNSEVRVIEVVGADPAAYAALWRFLLAVDLTRRATYGFAPLDEPLVHLVDEPRRLGARLVDGLWLRIIDLPAALAARRYAAPVDVVLDVTDEQLPQNTGRWRLVGGPDGATCTPTGDPADLACTAQELGAAYLGGPSLGALAAAGAVRELTAGSLAPASAAFGWHRQPQAIEVF